VSASSRVQTAIDQVKCSFAGVASASEERAGNPLGHVDRAVGHEVASARLVRAGRAECDSEMHATPNRSDGGGVLGPVGAKKDSRRHTGKPQPAEKLATLTGESRMPNDRARELHRRRRSDTHEVAPKKTKLRYRDAFGRPTGKRPSLRPQLLHIVCLTGNVNKFGNFCLIFGIRRRWQFVAGQTRAQKKTRRGPLKLPARPAASCGNTPPQKVLLRGKLSSRGGRVKLADWRQGEWSPED
jgi:hypothetical protein